MKILNEHSNDVVENGILRMIGILNNQDNIVCPFHVHHLNCFAGVELFQLSQSGKSIYR